MTKDKKQEKCDDKDLNETPEEINDSGEAATEQPEAKNEAETYLDNWKRTQADFLNYKRRCEQEKEDTIKFGNSMLLLALLPALDDLQRALDSVPKDIDKVPWVEGIRLIERRERLSILTYMKQPCMSMAKTA